MITAYLLDGKFEQKRFDNFEQIRESIDTNRKKLYEMKLEVIISIFDQLSKKIMQDAELMRSPGISYVTLWLRKNNLRNICQINLGNIAYADNYAETLNNIEICAQPRGVVCHWIAENVPTLGIFSIIMSLLAKNGNIVKVSDFNKDVLVRFFKNLETIKVEEESKVYSGSDILNAISFVSFDIAQKEHSEQMSMAADCKIIWGGKAAVAAITAMPQREHCEIITFGPKYSFAVYDKECIESNMFEQYLEKTVTDICVFNQMACSSPHVIFFEKSKYSLEEIAKILKKKFEGLTDKFFTEIQQGTAAKIINARGEYLLDKEKSVVMPEHLGWTILINYQIQLEEPIHGRCIFIKQVDNIEDVLKHITRKVQTISIGILNNGKAKEFSKKASYLGAARCVSPGRMHDFDSPWDGILLLNRLVRWAVAKIK